MNEKTFSIKDLIEVTGWTYVTAHKFAKKHGKKNGEGRWTVPVDVVDAIVRDKVIVASQWQTKYQIVLTRSD